MTDLAPEQLIANSRRHGRTMTGSESAVGYEPFWAIGSGHMPTPDEITEVHAHKPDSQFPAKAGLAMCNLYSMVTNQQAIRALFRVRNDRAGNPPLLPGIFPDQQAPIVRIGSDSDARQ